VLVCKVFNHSFRKCSKRLLDLVIHLTVPALGEFLVLD
jgi:hypothetical protein